MHGTVSPGDVQYIRLQRFWSGGYARNQLRAGRADQDPELGAAHVYTSQMDAPSLGLVYNRITTLTSPRDQIDSLWLIVMY